MVALIFLFVGYGVPRRDAYRQAGNYAGRILKGEKLGPQPCYPAREHVVPIASSVVFRLSHRSASPSTTGMRS
jgi:hypothetical protein